MWVDKSVDVQYVIAGNGTVDPFWPGCEAMVGGRRVEGGWSWRVGGWRR